MIILKTTLFEMKHKGHWWSKEQTEKNKGMKNKYIARRKDNIGDTNCTPQQE